MAETFVRTNIRGDKVMVFTKPTCSYCILAKEVLSKYRFKTGHLEFIDISVREDMGCILDYMNIKTGARTIPRVFIGLECIGGGTDIEELDKSGHWRECSSPLEPCSDTHACMQPSCGYSGLVT